MHKVLAQQKMKSPMIRYSISWMRDLSSDDENAKKVYAHAQYTDVMDLWKFAQHISEHDSKYNRSDIVGVITTMVDCLYELLLDGKRVQLGDMGIFYSSIKSTGADSMSKFSEASNIVGLKVKWRRSSKFQKIYQDAEFMLVPTRKGFEEAKEKMKSALPDGTYSSSDDDSTESSGSSSGDSSSDGSGNDDDKE